MKSDISRFGDKLVLRDAELRGATAKEGRATEHFISSSNPQIGYKLPFFIGSRPFLTHEGQHSEQMRHQHGEGVELASIGIDHPKSSEAPSSTYEGAGKEVSSQVADQVSDNVGYGPLRRKGLLLSRAQGVATTSPDSQLFCRACPQYGHALIFPRKCYYEAQCLLPLLFCANQHGEKAVKTTLVHRHGRAHPTQNFLRRLSSTLSKKIAYKNPELQRTNFGWRKKQ